MNKNVPKQIVINSNVIVIYSLSINRIFNMNYIKC